LSDTTNIYFEKVSRIKGRKNRLLIVLFTDDNGKTYKWVPKWSDLKKIVEEALTTEVENQKILSTDRKWFEIVANARSDALLYEALLSKEISTDRLKECVMAFARYLHKTHRLSYRCYQRIASMIERNPNAFPSIAIVCAILKKGGLATKEDCNKIWSMLNVKGGQILRLSEVLEFREDLLRIKVGWRTLIRWMIDEFTCYAYGYA